MRVRSFSLFTFLFLLGYTHGNFDCNTDISGSYTVNFPNQRCNSSVVMGKKFYEGYQTKQRPDEAQCTKASGAVITKCQLFKMPKSSRKDPYVRDRE